MNKTQKLKYNRSKGEAIFLQLRSEVNSIVSELKDKRRSEIIFKSILFPSLYIGAWVCAIAMGNRLWILLACYFSMGLLLVLNYLNVIHDAVHHTIFRSRKMNELYVYIFDLMGANSYMWKNRHVLYHHNYPNVNGWDTDIDQSALVRITPHTPTSHFHRYQHIYLPFIYPLFLFNWLFIRDFRDFFDRSRIVHKKITVPVKEYAKLFFFKVIFISYTLFIPRLVLGISWMYIVCAFIVMVLTASIFALIVLLPPHANVDAEFPVPDENRILPYDWFTHMLRTTNDVTGENWWTRFVLGNFNYHVVHHLFPGIHHAYYPEITRRLVNKAAQYRLPYRSFPLGVALKKHYELLKLHKTDFDIWEEDM